MEEQRVSNLDIGQFIESKLELNDLVLSEDVLRSLDLIRYWWRFQVLNEEIPFSKRMNKGMKVIFHGNTGTGKSETAAILGREFDRKVYKIDHDQINSGQKGDNERNLSKIFEVAERENWILFFDEADNFFRKRPSVNNASDRYANIELIYYLQQIENFPGIIIVSTNFKDNLDPALIRRFNIVVEFRLPDKHHRRYLWEKLLNELGKYAPELNSDDWEELLKFELSGRAITNVVNNSLLKASYMKTQVQFIMLKESIVREMHKENRHLNL
jgi:SpoVK/Ycf46/Vps4 family AAA+-type ATPase